MNKIKILDESLDSKFVNIEATISIPEELQSIIGGAIEHTIKSMVQYSSISLSQEGKIKEITDKYQLISDDYILSLKNKFNLYGIEIEVK